MSVTPVSPSDVTLFGHWICPFSVRVEFALAQREIPYQLVNVPPTAARPRGFSVPAEFVAHSPKGEIPLLRIDGCYLADSIPILEWMEKEIAGHPLLPIDEATRQLVRDRVAWLDRYLYRPMIGVYYGTDPSQIAIAGDRLASALLEVEGWFNTSPWLAGETPSLAEAVMVAFHVRLDGLRRLGFRSPLPAGVADHAHRCRSLPGWGAVEWSPEQTDEFVQRFGKFREISLRSQSTAGTR